MNVKKMTTLSLIISVAMILSYIESLIPAFVAVPGVKVGLSNIATVFALYTLGAPYAIGVSLVRVLLSSLLFGTVASLIYSLSGALFALVVMITLKHINLFSEIGVSIAGGVMHNVGQVVAAALVMSTGAIAYYIPPLIVSGIIAGIAIGIVSGLLINRLKGKIGRIK